MNTTKSSPYLVAISGISVIAIFVQIMLGAVTRLTGSGLACPDWPLCYGLWLPFPSALSALPPIDFTYTQVLLEWAHRANAAFLLAPLVCCMAFLGWKYRGQGPIYWRLGLAAFCLLLVQSAVGGFTVFDKNSPWSVAIHLTLASLLLATAVSMLRLAKTGHSIRMGIRTVIPIVLALLVLSTMVSGAIVAKTGAALACDGWPLCSGSVLPDMDDIGQAVHLFHRFLAFVTVLGLLWAGWYLRYLRHAAVLSIFQVLMGLVVIVTYEGGVLELQVTVGALHQLFAAIIFAALVWTFWQPDRVK